MGIIKKVKQMFETQTTLLMKKTGTFKEEDIECSIDEQKIECSKLEAPIPEYSSYVGVPAPVYLNDDSWFGYVPVRSQNQIDYMQQEYKIKRQERENSFFVEPNNIHQRMYEIATQNNTAININPPGGSENFLDGGSNGYGWMSGTSSEQFL